MKDVTFITGTIPGREHLLAEAVASVKAQTVTPADHLIAVDYQLRGGWRPRNILAFAVETKWTHVLDDDDVLKPDHLERLLAHADGADVVYSHCEVLGDAHFDLYNRPFDAGLLRRMSIVSHNALIRTDLLLELGGWANEKGYDWRLWIRALDTGARFVCVPEKTWKYRLNADWQHESRP